MSGIQRLLRKKIDVSNRTKPQLSHSTILERERGRAKRKRPEGNATYHAELVEDRRVEPVLDVIDVLRHQAQSQLSVHEQVVQQTPGSVVAVAQSRMRRAGIKSEAQSLPLGNVVVGNG